MPFHYPWVPIIIALFFNTLLLFFLLIRLKGIGPQVKDFTREEYQSNRKFIITLFLIIALGFLLRVWQLGQEEFETQELSHLFSIVKELSLSFTNDTIIDIKHIILHPLNLRFTHQPITSLLVYFLILINKFNIPEEFLFRLPSLLFGTATIWAVFLLAKELFDKKTALVASFLFALSPFHLYYSRSLEPYAALCFFAVISSYLFILIFFKNKRKLSAVYLITIIIAFFFHYCTIIILASHLATLLLLLFKEWSWNKYKLSILGLTFIIISIFIYYDIYLPFYIFYFFIILLLGFSKEREYITMKTPPLFFSILATIFNYIFILWYPILLISLDKRKTLFGLMHVFPIVFFDVLIFPMKLFQTLIGIAPKDFIATFIVLFSFLYCLIHIKIKRFNAFAILFSIILMQFICTSLVMRHCYLLTKGVYGNLYRHNILMLPLLYIVIAYGINLVGAKSIFLKRIKILILAICILTLFISNIRTDYGILTERQKPSYSEVLFFMNKFIGERDIIFFPIPFFAEHSLYYLNRNNRVYTPELYESIKQSFNYRSNDFFMHKNIPILVNKFSSLYERIWVVVFREEIFKRTIFNRDYTDRLLDYLGENHNFVLCKKFKYVDIYLFALK